MNWRDLAQAIITSNLIGFNIVPIKMLRRGKWFTDAETPLRSLTQILFMENVGAGRPGFTRFKSIDLMYYFRSSLATMPHDYCYGLLGIAEESGHPDLQLDYTLPVEEVYRQFARASVREGDGLKVLYSASLQRLKLPSWVPDWSYGYKTQLRAPPNSISEPMEGWPAAGLASPSLIQIHSHLQDILLVRGIIIDHIETIGLCYLSTLSSNGNENKLPSTPMRGSLDPTKAANLRPATDCIIEIIHLIRNKPNPAHAATEPEETIIWKTLSCGFPDLPGYRSGFSPVDAYRQLLHLLTMFLPESPVLHMLNLEPRPPILPPSLDDIAQQGGLFLGALYENCYDKRRGRTAGGYVGQFSHLVQVGDIVFLPLGSPVPFMIRAKGDGTYRLLGDCYFHGIMNGGAFGFEGVEEEDILLS